MASRIAGALDRLREFQEERARMAEPTLVDRADSTSTKESEEHNAQPAVTPVNGSKWGTPIFLRGMIRKIDCSAEPSAVLTVVSGSKTVQVKIADKTHVILIGADQFSCSWSNKKIAVNYRQNEKGDTNVMSVELQ
jgi:hypothetical protein